MNKLFKVGIAVPVLVLALVIGFSAMADNDDLNREANRDLNDGQRQTPAQQRADDDSLAAVGDSANDVVATDNPVDSRGNTRVDRRGRRSSSTNVDLASEKGKWWSNNDGGSDNEGSDEGGDEGDDEDEGGDMSPHYPTP